MEVSLLPVRKSKKRPERAMYITPGRRKWESVNSNQVGQNQKGEIDNVVINCGDGFYDDNPDINLGFEIPDEIISMMISQSTEKNCVSEEVVKILTTFYSTYGKNMDAAKKKEMGFNLIKYAIFLLENYIESMNVVEKLVIILVTYGKNLERDSPKKLDSLFTLMRDKFLENDTSSETRRYLMSVIESRAMNWSTRHV